MVPCFCELPNRRKQLFWQASNFSGISGDVEFDETPGLQSSAVSAGTYIRCRARAAEDPLQRSKGLGVARLYAATPPPPLFMASPPPPLPKAVCDTSFRNRRSWKMGSSPRYKNATSR